MDFKKIKLKKGLVIKNITTQIDDLNLNLSYEGLCVFRECEIPIFVYNLLPGEEADIEITYYSKKCCFAKVIKYHSYSFLRKKLDYYEEQLYKSGSSPLMALEYNNQLKFKQNLVKYLFERNLNYSNISNIVKSPDEFNYRNKITLHVEYSSNKAIFGFYKQHSHKLIQQEKLLLANSKINEFYEEFLSNSSNNKNNELNNFLFDLKPNKITLRSPNLNSNEIELILETSRNINQQAIEKLEIWNSKFLDLKITIFDKKNCKWINLLNHNGIEFKIDDNKFLVKNNTFYQVNESVMYLIYNKIKEWINADNLNILDAFGGVGTIGIFVSSKSKNVYTVEVNKTSTQNAIKNIQINNASNVVAINADANKWILENYKKIDLAIFDPPREGLGKETIQAIIQSNINQIIYLSCDPKTLIRDLKELTRNDYTIKEVKLYDMFPQTPHVETLCLLSKLNTQKHIDLELTTDEQK